MNAVAAIVWTLRKGEHQIALVRRPLARGGIGLELLFDGRLFLSRRCRDIEEFCVKATENWQALNASGWRKE